MQMQSVFDTIRCANDSRLMIFFQYLFYYILNFSTVDTKINRIVDFAKCTVQIENKIKM